MLLLNVDIEFQMEKEGKIKLILKKSDNGLTITDLVKRSRLSRSTVIKFLAKMEGANKISFIKIGMAKVYSLNKGKNRK